MDSIATGDNQLNLKNATVAPSPGAPQPPPTADTPGSIFSAPREIPIPNLDKPLGPDSQSAKTPCAPDPCGGRQTQDLTAIAAISREAAQLQQAAGGPLTDAVAQWVASRYLLEARQRLDGAEAAPRWETLHAFAQDWARLRRGDHAAERLRFQRQRLDLAQRDLEQKHQNTIDIGIRALRRQIKRNIVAREDFDQILGALLPTSDTEFEFKVREWLDVPENFEKLLPAMTAKLSAEARNEFCRVWGFDDPWPPDPSSESKEEE